MSATVVWHTPDAEALIMYMARVSSEHPDSGDPRLIKYMIDNDHWSPFEMINMCVEINTTRDIGRQILRHRSFSFQEFSQRYAVVPISDDLRLRQARTQDTKKRQRSHETTDEQLKDTWRQIQVDVRAAAADGYNRAISLGIAKEVARAILPEGLTPTRMYMNGTLRSWIHYVNLRAAEGTQLEHQDIARQIKAALIAIVPKTAAALGWVAAQ